MSKKRKRKKLVSKILKAVLLIIIALVALVLIAYPYISNYIYEHQAGGIIKVIEQQEEDSGNQEMYAQEIAKAREYNATLAKGNITLKDPFVEEDLPDGTEKYSSLLNMTEDGVMGFVKIPCIDVSIPIYHGTSSAVLEKGSGHLEGTSLPVGGESTHSVLTGHSGLNRAKLFSDLSDLEIGDMFFLFVMGEKLAYVVDDIKTVLPSEVSTLTIVPGMDYCTLITCTPYGVNTHRLLVRGVRTEYVEESQNPEAYKKKNTGSQWMRDYLRSIIISSILFIILIILLAAWRYLSYLRWYRKAYIQEIHKKKKKKKI